MSALEQLVARRPPRKITIRLQRTNYNVSEPILAEISEVRQDPVVFRPSLYRMEVESFACDVKLPVFQPLLDPSNTPNGTIYSFTLKHGGDSATRNMTFQPQNTSVATSDFEYYRCYSFQHVVDMVNDCLKQVFDDLAAAASLPTTNAPFFVIDTDESFKMTLIADKAGFDQKSLPTPIEIYCNEPMERLLAGFYFLYSGSGSSYAKFIIESTVANTVNDGYHQVMSTQEQASALSNWSPIRSIAFLSNNLPVRKALIGHDGDYGVENVTSGVATSRDIAMIAEIPMNELNKDDLGTITYTPQYEKLLDLEGGGPISSLNVSMFYSDGPHLHPVQLHTGGHISMTINFHLRDDL